MSACQALAVYKKLNLRLIGVNRHLCGVLHAIHITLAADVYEGVLGKPCLIRIESILLIFAVEGYKALVVHAVLSALCAGICSEVEHIPYMSCPDERSAEQLLDQLLMIISLILFRVVTLHRIRGVPVQSLTAVLTHTNSTVRIFLVELIKEFAVHIGCSAVPA